MQLGAPAGDMLTTSCGLSLDDAPQWIGTYLPRASLANAGCAVRHSYLAGIAHSGRIGNAMGGAKRCCHRRKLMALRGVDFASSEGFQFPNERCAGFRYMVTVRSPQSRAVAHLSHLMGYWTTGWRWEAPSGPEGGTPLLSRAKLFDGFWLKLLHLSNTRWLWPGDATAPLGAGLPTSALSWADVAADFQTRFLGDTGERDSFTRENLDFSVSNRSDINSSIFRRARRRLENAEVVLTVEEGVDASADWRRILRAAAGWRFERQRVQEAFPNRGNGRQELREGYPWTDAELRHFEQANSRDVALFAAARKLADADAAYFLIIGASR
eukprot:TRINITY_DN21973_c0_g1_i11.p1 TRINITY_DN21973_c0_g1~~TRINITY_DN21973_c0_g1_i11.p1  ORF type:complete len:376 (-),score=38.92 TRINITY_DN21973_c0_g1_i11:91-1068(-)